MRRRIGNRLDLRKGWVEPPGPQPGDYLPKIKAWLEDGRTQARQAFEVLDWYDLGYLWVSWPLPLEYRVHAGPPDGLLRGGAGQGPRPFAAAAAGLLLTPGLYELAR